jgi:hypothetical protein
VTCFEFIKSDLPKDFPTKVFWKLLSARFRLFMPGRARMACQQVTGKVKRIAVMMHEEAAKRSTARRSRLSDRASPLLIVAGACCANLPNNAH